MEGNREIGKDEVIAKLKDDGDFDKLRLKVIRKLKDNEELRNNMVAIVKQSLVLNRPGAESMKPRQLSDAIYEEVGDKLMGKVSDGLWEIIRSADGMRSEIAETVQSVYNKLANPKRKEESEASFQGMIPIQKESDNNGHAMTSHIEKDNAHVDSDPKEPPGFSLACSHENNHHVEQHKEELQPAFPHEKGLSERKEEAHHPMDLCEADDEDLGVPPGFAADEEHEQPCDGSDEDPDVPPGFG